MKSRAHQQIGSSSTTASVKNKGEKGEETEGVMHEGNQHVLRSYAVFILIDVQMKKLSSARREQVADMKLASECHSISMI